MNQDYEPEPHYEAEDIGCECTGAGIDSEWNWDSDQCCYICEGCGMVQ